MVQVPERDRGVGVVARLHGSPDRRWRLAENLQDTELAVALAAGRTYPEILYSALPRVTARHAFALQLKTTEDYVWNQRETTSRGTSILEFVDFGINRVKYACGVVSGLLKELKQASIAGKCRTMVVIDAFNIFTTNSTRIFDDKKVMVLPKNITLARAFYDMTKDDWCNGAVVLTVDETVDRVRTEDLYRVIRQISNIAINRAQCVRIIDLEFQDREESHLPRYLLRKEGFEHLDPFIPILVENYTVAEYESMVEYYKNRKWIRELTPSAQKELEMVTNRHPLTLMDRCKFL